MPYECSTEIHIPITPAFTVSHGAKGRYTELNNWLDFKNTNNKSHFYSNSTCFVGINLIFYPPNGFNTFYQRICNSTQYSERMQCHRVENLCNCATYINSCRLCSDYRLGRRTSIGSLAINFSSDNQRPHGLWSSDYMSEVSQISFTNYRRQSRPDTRRVKSFM